MLYYGSRQWVISHVQCSLIDPLRTWRRKGQEKQTITIYGDLRKHRIGWLWLGSLWCWSCYEWQGKKKAQRFVPDPERSMCDNRVQRWFRRHWSPTGQEPRDTAEHALHVLEIIEAARESCGKKIKLQNQLSHGLYYKLKECLISEEF